MKKFFLKINEKVFYGWVVVIASLIIGLAGFGIRYSFGVFFKSIEMEFGLSRAATSGIFSAHMVGSSISTVLGGWALDRYGPRKLTCLMGVFTGLSLLLASQATAPWHLYMSYSLLLALGTGPIFPVVNSTSSQWFNRRRGL
ncbi:MAG: MFS transporter, partial [Syntrophales bacterium LBB04]|nr:MFS transporter [Syntrophales bacterium LBB04]